MVRRVSSFARPLATASDAPHWLFKLTHDALQAVVPVWSAGSPLSAGLLTAASAAPHWPVRLKDDAVQAVVPVWSAGSPLSARPLVTASAVPHWLIKLIDDGFKLLACLAVQGTRSLQGC